MPVEILNLTGDLVVLGPLRRDLIPVYLRWSNDLSTSRTLDQIVAIFGYLRRGDQDRTSSIVRNLTGREPRGLGQFLREHAGFFQARAA